jgi:hypothetical protein
MDTLKTRTDRLLSMSVEGGKWMPKKGRMKNIKSFFQYWRSHKKYRIALTISVIALLISIARLILKI